MMNTAAYLIMRPSPVLYLCTKEVKLSRTGCRDAAMQKLNQFEHCRVVISIRAAVLIELQKK